MDNSGTLMMKLTNSRIEAMAEMGHISQHKTQTLWLFVFIFVYSYIYIYMINKWILYIYIFLLSIHIHWDNWNNNVYESLNNFYDHIIIYKGQFIFFLFFVLTQAPALFLSSLIQHNGVIVHHRLLSYKISPQKPRTLNIIPESCGHCDSKLKRNFLMYVHGAPAWIWKNYSGRD